MISDTAHPAGVKQIQRSDFETRLPGAAGRAHLRGDVVPAAQGTRIPWGYGILLVVPESGLVIGLHTNTGNQHEGFLEARTVLDHVSFLVGTRADLEAWMTWLDELRIERTPIRDEKEPFAYSTIVFRDPDNIQLEFVAVG
ncbi:VOC family protein [Streptomyces sp. NPDC086549]|uniref:VOC family protein n=1 Tax=Streptomyces sp. NPDC086549 TaxID=3365752 RepID=UPI003807884E